MTTNNWYARLCGGVLTLALGIACSSDATAQQAYRTWFPTPAPTAAPTTQYYSYHYAPPTCPGGACGANRPQYQSCPNGSCAPRTWMPTAAPTVTPVESLRNGVQRVFSPVLPIPQSTPRPMPANAPSANRESPYYEYKAAPGRSAVRTRPAQAAPADDDSPYYP